MRTVDPDKLSLMTVDELRMLADAMGLNLPEGLERLFILEEILDAVDEERRERSFAKDGPGHVDEKKYSGAFSGIADSGAGIGYNYNETMIHAMARDPSWLFAYWDIAENRKACTGPEDAAPGFFLRVTEFKPGQEHQKRAYFDIPVSCDDSQWYINVPHPGATYRVDLCMKGEAKPKLLAKSPDVKLPLQFIGVEPASLPRATQRLLMLSGSGELSIEPPSPSNPSRILQDGE